jgi:hypothetical protein
MNFGLAQRRVAVDEQAPVSPKLTLLLRLFQDVIKLFGTKGSMGCHMVAYFGSLSATAVMIGCVGDG